MRIIGITIGLSLLGVWCGQAQSAPATKPNIILIFADDLGWRDVGYQSEGKFLTPNIDRLAQEGMVFTSAYPGGANCEPSRAWLLSGGYNRGINCDAAKPTLNPGGRPNLIIFMADDMGVSDIGCDGDLNSTVQPSHA